MWTWNTMLVAVVSTAISLVLGVMLAYPLARMRFPGAALISMTVAATYLVPQPLLFVPLADIINHLGLGNTLTSVILTYPTLLMPFCAWLLMGYFKTVPKELEEAARIDGASRLQTMCRDLPAAVHAGLHLRRHLRLHPGAERVPLRADLPDQERGAHRAGRRHRRTDPRRRVLLGPVDGRRPCWARSRSRSSTRSSSSTMSPRGVSGDVAEAVLSDSVSGNLSDFPDATGAGDAGPAAVPAAIVFKPPPFRYFLDEVSDNGVGGWITKRDEPEYRCIVALKEGGRVLARAVASRFREDLLFAGIGDGCYAFSLEMPRSLLDGEDHLLDIVEEESGFALTGEPRRWRSAAGTAGSALTGIGADAAPDAKLDRPLPRAEAEIIRPFAAPGPRSAAGGTAGTRAAAHSGTRVLVDISDLVYYIAEHANLTGIQRVQSSIVLAMIDGRVIPPAAVIFLSFNARTRDWVAVPTGFLLSLLRDLFLPEPQRLISFPAEEARYGMLPGARPFDGTGVLDDGNPSVLCLLGRGLGASGLCPSRAGAEAAVRHPLRHDRARPDPDLRARDLRPGHRPRVRGVHAPRAAACRSCAGGVGEHRARRAPLPRHAEDPRAGDHGDAQRLLLRGIPPRRADGRRHAARPAGAVRAVRRHHRGAQEPSAHLRHLAAHDRRRRRPAAPDLRRPAGLEGDRLRQRAGRDRLSRRTRAVAARGVRHRPQAAL